MTALPINAPQAAPGGGIGLRHLEQLRDAGSRRLGQAAGQLRG